MKEKDIQLDIIKEHFATEQYFSLYRGEKVPYAIFTARKVKSAVDLLLDEGKLILEGKFEDDGTLTNIVYFRNWEKRKEREHARNT